MTVKEEQILIQDKTNDREKDKYKHNFLESINAIQKIIKTSGSILTKDEIAVYFKDMKLSEQQLEMVYQYLQKPQEEAENETWAEMQFSVVEKGSAKETDMQAELPDTAFFRLYLDDMKRIPQCTKADEELLYESLIAGDGTSVNKLSEQWMHKVLQIAKKQMTAADPKEFADIIQEGNMGIFLTLQKMLGSGKRMDFEKELTKAAQDAMKTYMQKTTADTDMDRSLLAKASLVYEARKFLAEQLQRLPSQTELSQYTKLPETELEDIMAILEEKK